MRVLVLGGTGDAHRLCLDLFVDGVDLVHSLAGVLERRLESTYPLHVGGFGGSEGLSEFLRHGGFTHVVLATHPFACRIAGHAVKAAADLDLPLIALLRPEWRQPAGADWRPYDTPDALADALPTGARVFLTVGRKHLHPYFSRPDLWYLLRVMESSGKSFNGIEIVGRPPFTVDEECDLMQRHSIDCLVSKNSGGEATFAKIAAAARLGLPVYLLRRPHLNVPEKTGDIDGVKDWLYHK